MPREKKHILDHLDLPVLEILGSLKSQPKSFTELSRECSLSKSNFNDRLNDLIKLGLVIEILKDIGNTRKRKAYALTNTGKQILLHLKEIEKIYSKEVRGDRELKDVEKELESLELTKKPEKEIHEAMSHQP